MILKRYKQQKGQSLIYVAILIVVLVSGVFFVYDIGNIVNTKIKFQNGADSAALSAVAVKISKHHVDAMVRTSMFHESVAAQAQQRAAQALLLKILLDVKGTKPGGDMGIPPIYTGPGTPGQPGNIVQPQPALPSQAMKDDAKRYKQLANLTYRHVVKLHRERKALDGYYKWMAADGRGLAPQAVIEASRIGLRGNTFGLYSASNLGLAQNLKLLEKPEDLIENIRQFHQVGGVPYSNEGANMVGNFGKTFVEFDGKGVLSSQGTSLLNYFDKLNQYTLLTNAAARVASSDELRTKKAYIGTLSGSVPFEMLWYSPRLMSIFKNTETSLH